MSRKRGLVLVVGLLALLGGAGVVYRSQRAQGDGEGGAAGERAAGAKAGRGGAGDGDARPELPPDPRTVARGSIAGHVRDTAGAPIAGADVCAHAGSRQLTSAETRTPSCARSGADGAYRIGELYKARYGVSAGAPSYRPGDWHDAKKYTRTSFDLAAGEARTGVDVVLEGGGVEVKGRVSDISGGPVAGAVVTVSAGRWGGGGGVLVRSADDGGFSAWAAPGAVTASAEAEGYSPGSKSGVAPGLFLEILLTPETVLVGRVVDAGSDHPVAGAMVSVSGDDDFGGFGRWRASGTTALTDADGRFRIERLQPGRYKPSAEAAGKTGQARESVLLGLGETSGEVVIEVHRAAMVEGVVLAGGKPCPDSWVQLDDRKNGRSAGAAGDAEGRVVLRAVLPGEYEQSVWCESFPHRQDFATVAVADADVRGLEWKLEAGLSVRGRMIDSAGAPVAKGTLWGQLKGGDPRAQRGWGWAETDAKGEFVIEGLRAGDYAFEVDAEGYPRPKDPVEVAVQDDVSGLTITLDASGAIDGVVTDEDGKPVAGIDVQASGERWDWSNSGTTTRDDGSYSLKGLRAGEYRVTAMRSWNALRAPGTGDDDVQGQKTKVAAGQRARVDLRVESLRGTIAGRVVDEKGQAVPDAFLDAQRESESATAQEGNGRRGVRWGWDRKPTLTDVDGHFTITGLAKGKYTLRAYRKGGGEAFVEHVELGASSVELSILTPGTISGTVAGAGATPPEEFTITIIDRQAGFRRREEFFRTAGQWVMRDLPAGKFTVSVDAAAGNDSEEILLAQGEQKQGVRFELAARANAHGRLVDLETGKPVPGMMVMVREMKGGGSSWAMNDGAARKNVSDADGKFEVERAPAGRVRVMAFPQDWNTAEYAYAQIAATLPAGQDTELPPIRLPRLKIKMDDTPADLGFGVKEQPPDTEPDQMRWLVAVVRADGPAKPAGLKVGDEVVAVDGHACIGAEAYLFDPLTNVKQGTVVTLTVRRAGAPEPVQVAITAGPPL